MKQIPRPSGMLPDREYPIRHKKDGSPINDGIRAKKRLEQERNAPLTRRQIQERKNADRNLKNKIMMEKRNQKPYIPEEDTSGETGTAAVADIIEGRR